MSVSDAELAGALAGALGRQVVIRAREPWEYASSAWMERLCVDGCPPLLFKDVGARAGAAPSFVLDPWREIEAYARYLDGLDAPACVAVVTSENRAWLFVEQIDGVPLWQAAGKLPWLATARWLARLHARPVPASAGRLLVRDRAHLRCWVRRALASAPPGTLVGVDTSALAAVESLLAWPVSLIHGELYPSNVLVQAGDGGPRIRPLDWEMAGVGPGLLDLAALISGDHHPRLRDAIVAAYADQAGVDLGDRAFTAGLRAARLLVALQWIGWAPKWTPPAAHAHDWLADARALVAGGPHDR
jgi:aminoglycoside phosphotransferase (APT) family kinase protein